MNRPKQNKMVHLIIIILASLCLVVDFTKKVVNFSDNQLFYVAIIQKGNLKKIILNKKLLL